MSKKSKKAEFMPQTYTATSISPELADRLRAMPKAEIHVHLEGVYEAISETLL